MKGWLTTAVVVSLLAGCGLTQPSVPATNDAVKILSFNIRYGSADDGADAWPHRREMVYDVIRERDSDFVGLQEALRFQIDDIREAVPGYDEIGVGRTDGRREGEYSAILYKPDRWRVAESGTFWLSDTPEIPGSTSWGNEITRIVTWGRLVERNSGRGIRVFNTHFDHESQPSRQRSAELLAARLASRGGTEPVVVTGDFNAGENNPAVLYLKNAGDRSPVSLVDTYRVLHPGRTPAGTFNAFEGRRDGPKIDYVFVERGTEVRRAGIIHDNDAGRYPSDHFPVFAEIGWPPKPR